MGRRPPSRPSIHVIRASADPTALACMRGNYGNGVTPVFEGKRMHFDLTKIAASDAYKLLISTVVPRPIALATTVDCDGRATPPRSVF